MGVRFTETNKWEDPWFSELTLEQKILFLYIVDKCNIAGFYELNYKIITLNTGLSKDQIEGALKGLARGIQGASDSSNWVWVKNFLKHQKNSPLNPLNKSHIGIMKCIAAQPPSRFTNNEIAILREGALKGLGSPTGIGIGIGKGGVGGIPPLDKKGSDLSVEELKNLLAVPRNKRTKIQEDQIYDASVCGRKELFELF